MGFGWNFLSDYSKGEIFKNIDFEKLMMLMTMMMEDLEIRIVEVTFPKRFQERYI